MCGFGHGIKSLGALMFKDTCTVGKMLRSNHGNGTPLSPVSWEARVTNDLCKKRTFVYKSTFFHQKKKKKKEKKGKKTGENRVSWLSSDFWLRQHGPLFLSGFCIRLVLTHSLTQSSINQSSSSLTQDTHSSTHLIIHSLIQ